MGVERANLMDSAPQIFEHQVDEHPSHIILRSGGIQLRYEELESQANIIGNHLLALRGAMSEPVSILTRNAASMLAASLGVMKTGKYFIPINPQLPPPRLRHMIDAANCGIVICDLEGERALDLADIRVERLALTISSGHGQSTARPTVAITPDSIAYVLFTSGSSGHPKGVAQSHRSMVHNVLRHGKLALCPEDRVTLISSDGFVGTISNPYMAIFNGASLAPRSFYHDGIFETFDWLSETHINVCYMFPSFLRQLITAVPKGKTHALRLLYLGGETVHPSDLLAAREMFPKAVVAVGLNSTETGLTRLNLISPEAPVQQDIVPVGGPVPDVDIEIIDNERAQPLGLAGEIVVRSEYVRPFYLEDKKLIDVTEPVSPETSVRRFRTADRGYLSEDHQLVHLGRLDGMVKVRGHRVELIEVEAALNAILGVIEAAVTVDTVDGRDTELHAFVVTDGSLDAPEIRRKLLETLPTSMTPSVVTLVSALPRTSNGKVDRRTLSSSITASPEVRFLNTTPVADSIPGRIHNLWQAMLRTSEITLDDNFFDLGGESILALKVVSRLRKDFGVPLPLQTIFEQPTIRALSQEIVRLLQERRQMMEQTLT